MLPPLAGSRMKQANIQNERVMYFKFYVFAWHANHLQIILQMLPTRYLVLYREVSALAAEVATVCYNNPRQPLVRLYRINYRIKSRKQVLQAQVGQEHLCKCSRGDTLRVESKREWR